MDRRGSQPAAEAGSGGSDRPLVGRPPAGADGGAPDRSRRYGDGSSASPSNVSTGYCATRRASPARTAAGGGDRGQILALPCGEPPRRDTPTSKTNHPALHSPSTMLLKSFAWTITRRHHPCEASLAFGTL